jgi:hypothetical protein
VSTETIAPAAPDLAAYAATQAVPREAATLARFGAQRITFAKDDPDLIVGMAVCKPGVFNGVFEVTRDDLDAWVQRFNELRGVFRPPLRLDHGWSILEVIGRYEDLRVENRADESAGGTVVPMLVGDVRLVGTPEERQLIREWIVGDKLNERSSEFWPYRTNTGAEYPSVFAGCAFVDIPAVEGLGAITLRRATLAADTTTPEGTSMDDEQTPATEDEQTPDQPDQVVSTDDDVEEEPVVEEEPAGEPLVIGDADDDGDDPADDDEQPVGEVPADLSAALRAAGVNLDARQAATLASAIERTVELRRQADERVAKFRTKGLLVPAVAEHLERLLRHEDVTVRDDIAHVLEHTSAPVKLREAVGTRTSLSSGAPAGDRTTEVIHLDMTREEAVEAYTALDADGRVKYRHELAAWQDAHPTGE